jgi:electron transport complex protein RnfC
VKAARIIDRVTTTDSASATARAMAMPHALRGWPAQPPAFDSIDISAPAPTPAPSSTADVASGDLSFWIDRLKALRVQADRRCSPNLTEQLHAALRRPIDTIICHALDTDPAACVLSAWASTRVEELVAGLALLARLTNATTRWIVIDDRAPSSWWSKLRPAARAAALRPMALENDYPQADPTLMLYTLLGRRLRPGRLPVEQGVLMLDAVAAVAIGAAALRDEPMSRVPLAVRDHDRGESFFLTVPIGSTVSSILALLTPGMMESTILLRFGDALRDQRIDGGALVGESELVLHVSTPPPASNPQPCIRCGWCYESCPTRVQPADILEAAQRKDLELAERAGLESCIECGICAYVCPSKLPLLAGIRAIRR